MNWLFDLGNTRIKCAPLMADGQRGTIQALAHGAGAEFVDALRAMVGPAADGAVAWLASVAGAEPTQAAIETLRGLGYAVRIARSRAHCGRLRNAYARPERLGVDRFLALLAASARDDGPWLLVSVGSAVTVDLLAADGRHVGGAIAITPEHARQALAARFPVLELAPGRDDRLFADDTADAVAAGTRAAAIGLIERARVQARAELGAEPTLLMAGGGSDDLGPIAGAVPLPGLVLDGLARYATLAPAD